MTFKYRRAFTLAELLIATIIFGFMMTSMAGIYSTANKHMFQNYRQNTIKSSALVAMKTITSRLQEANRIDVPAPNASGNTLAFAINVDQLNGCYRINSQVVPTWHYVCLAPAINIACPYGNCLYYHTGDIAGGGGCPAGPFWSVGSYPVGACGQAVAGQTVTQLSAHVIPVTSLFSRTAADVAGKPVVKVRMRVFWDPATNFTPGTRDFRTAGQRVDATLITAVRLNVSAP
ncbi:MAG: hypothetical protein A2X35_10315 [Elusimicrobia bacterium GWA2_61_42]|nr:MAG: hypothetical protein A2X35_10315 [Elusimicrobia bacterium GWA2_61_42]OGR74656.1 MAG: hypothetical protein A2X38_02280 [Elusimicrobia bacterium GWC2_61_25]